MPILKVRKRIDRLGRNVRIESASPHWLGDHATPKAGSMRARVKYVCDVCERCGKKATDRHHDDGNTLNNEPTNIKILCRKCHMIVDGRLLKLRAARRKAVDPPKPCVNCRQLAKPLRRGLCHRCNEFARRNDGLAWTKARADKTGRRTPDRPCSNCNRMVGLGWCKGRCPACRLYLSYHGVERPLKKLVLKIIAARPVQP